MQKLQTVIIRTYLLITLLLVGSGILFPASQNLWLFRYFTIFSLFLISIFYKIKERSQTHLPFALLFTAIGDAFLYLPLSLKYLRINIPFGLFSFTMAYIIISSTYLKALFPDKKIPRKFFYLIQLAFHFSIGSIMIYFLRRTNLDYLGFGSAFMLSLLLVFFSALNLFFSTNFSNRIKTLILLSTILMIICDIGVILGFSLTALDPTLFKLGTSIVWSAYVPAWTIICVLSMDAEFNKLSLHY